MIFSELGVSLSTTLQQYKQYIMKIQVEGIFGAYNVIDSYLNIRPLDSEDQIASVFDISFSVPFLLIL